MEPEEKPNEDYAHLDSLWMNMKVGSLVSIIWTEGCETPAVVGVVTGIGPHEPLLSHSDHRIGHVAQLEHLTRQKIEIHSSGKRHWCDRGDLRVVA